MKGALTSVLMMICLTHIYSQSTLSFCASVEAEGYCVFDNNKFFLTPDSTNQRIYMEVRTPNTFTGTAKIIFKMYSVAKSGEEKYESMTSQDVKDDWRFAWLPHVFKGPGKYNVKIYNDQDQLICSKAFELFSGK